MHAPQQAHLEAAIGVVNYLCKFPALGLWFPRREGYNLIRFSNANYADDRDDKISTKAYVFTLGKIPISWCSCKQQTIARLSYESKYQALARCSCEAIWLSILLGELGFETKQPIPYGAIIKV